MECSGETGMTGCDLMVTGSSGGGAGADSWDASSAGASRLRSVDRALGTADAGLGGLTTRESRSRIVSNLEFDSVRAVWTSDRIWLKSEERLCNVRWSTNTSLERALSR